MTRLDSYRLLLHPTGAEDYSTRRVATDYLCLIFNTEVIFIKERLHELQRGEYSWTATAQTIVKELLFQRLTLTWTLLRILRILHTAWWLPMTFLQESWITNKPKDELWSTGNLIDAIKLAQISENHEPVWNTFPRSPGALVGLRPKTPFRTPLSSCTYYGRR